MQRTVNNRYFKRVQALIPCLHDKEDGSRRNITYMEVVHSPTSHYPAYVEVIFEWEREYPRAPQMQILSKLSTLFGEKGWCYQPLSDGTDRYSFFVDPKFET